MKKGGNTGYDISRPLNRVRDFFIIKSGSFRMEEKMQVYEELVARGLIAQVTNEEEIRDMVNNCLLYTSPSPRDVEESRMPSSA